MLAVYYRLENLEFKMPIEVREITLSQEDFKAVTQLLAELGRPNLQEQHLEQVYATYVAHVENPLTHSLLGFVDGVAKGFVSLEFRRRLNWGTWEAWVPDFIVTESARGTGVGHALFDAAIRLAQAKGCHRMSLESGYSRTVAHQFYERHCMVNSGYFFTLQPEVYDPSS